MKNKKLEGMPLYIPDLIKEATIIDDNLKSIMVDVLVNHMRKSEFELDSKSVELKDAIPDALKYFKERLPDKKTAKSLSKKRTNYQALSEFEEIIFKIIEQKSNKNVQR